MSRICGFEDTTTGHPCQNIVEDGHDHCEAQHPCPPVPPASASQGASGSVAEFAAETEDLASHWVGAGVLTLPPGVVPPVASVRVGDELELTRDVLITEHIWLPRDLKAGERVVRASDPYGVCLSQEIPCRFEPDGTYYGLPPDALKAVPWVEDVKTHCKYCAWPLRLVNGCWVSRDWLAHCPSTGPNGVAIAGPSKKHVPNKTSKPTLSKEVLDLKAKAEALRVHYQDALDVTLGTTTSTYHTEARLEALRKKALAVAILASGKQTQELLTDCLGLLPIVSYITTVNTEPLPPSGKPEVDKYALSPCGLAQHFQLITTSTMLVRGQLNGHSRRHWYIMTSCTEEHENSPLHTVPAYVRLRGERAWYGKNRLSTVEERHEAFYADLNKAKEVVALCANHRAFEKSMPLSPVK